jgi:hypothetical protein
LRHEAGDHAIESHVVEETHARELREAVDSVRRPVTVCFDDERTLARLEANAHGVGRALCQRFRFGMRERRVALGAA